MNKKERIKELETELRILGGDIFVADRKSGFHAHHNKRLFRYLDIVSELEKISLKYKIKKFFRRIKRLWQR